MASESVTVKIDGKEVTVPTGTLIIRAAEQLGVEIPRFCDHPFLDPIGACRQCYVEVEGQRKLMTSCTTPVGPDMVVMTQATSEQAKQAQVANLEFLLLNHPLDCPICDRGGECPLQDQALAFGPGESRYIDPKRVYEKPLNLSPLVALDRERCVLCARCTRFCDQISGDRFIELFDRGAAEQVAIAPGEDFRSPYSGNTIQICPVGALTARPYRFAARPFDLQHADTVCPHCASGCNLRVDTRRGQVVRHLARDNVDVNDAWTCDKGRFAFRFPDSEDRLKTPLLRDHGLEPVAFEEAFADIARRSAGKRVAFLVGGRLCDEDAYALSKLARTAFGTNDLDHRRYRSGDIPAGIEARVAAGQGLTYQDVERASTIVVVGLDTEQELPILHLRIRKAVRERGARVFVIHPRRTRLWDVAEHILCPPGGEGEVLERLSAVAGDYGGEHHVPSTAAIEERIIAMLRHAAEGTVVIAGSRLAESPGAVERAADLASAVGGRFALVSRRAGDHGAMRAGLHPALLPGGRFVGDAAARADLETVWGSGIPSEPGRDAHGILEAAARREIDVLYLVGVDPLRDHPDARLALHALRNVEHKIVQDINGSHLAPFADVMLPAAAFLERDGHYTTWEGRGQRLRPVRAAPGIARPDWEILQGLSVALDHDMGFTSLEAVHEEMADLLGPAGSRSGGSGASGAPPRAEGAERPPRSEPDGTSQRNLTLFTYPLLVDEGRMLEAADELKAALQDPAFVEIHPEDAERLGIADGEPTQLRTEAGQAIVPARVTPEIAAGSCFVPFNNPGLQANILLSGRFVTGVAVEAANGG
ncbi:MAG: NADH-quinone oxidoreductase subunit G [Actinomycetota bacterium]